MGRSKVVSLSEGKKTKRRALLAAAVEGVHECLITADSPDMTGAASCGTGNMNGPLAHDNSFGPFAHVDSLSSHQLNADGFSFFLTDGARKEIECNVSTEAARDQWVSKIKDAVAAAAAEKPKQGLPAVTHRGFVRKRGQINTAFQNRYFVLCDGMIKYYKTWQDFQDGKKEQGALLCENLSVDIKSSTKLKRPQSQISRRSLRQRLSKKRQRVWQLEIDLSKKGLFEALFGTPRSASWDLSQRMHAKSRMIHPDSPFQTGCIFISMLLCIYVAIIVQLEVAFMWDHPLCGEGMPTEHLDALVDIWLLFEILLTFLTGVYKEGVYFDDMSSVAASYVYSGSFFLDIVTSIPYTLIIMTLRAQVCIEETSHIAVGDSEASSIDQIKLPSGVQLLRPLRLLRVLRIIGLWVKLEKSNVKLGWQILADHMRIPLFARRMAGTVLCISFVIHSGTCLYWFCKVNSTSEDQIEEFLHDLHDIPPRLSPAQRLVNSYVIAFYFVNTIFTTVGFGDVLPVNNSERLCVVFLMHVGVLVFGFLMSEVQDIAADALEASRDHAKLRRRTLKFLKENEIPTSLTRHVTRWIEFSNNIKVRRDLQDDVLTQIPLSMKRRVLGRMHRGMLAKVSFLRDIETFRDDFLVDLFTRMQSEAFPKWMPVAMSRGPQADALIVLTHGQISVEFNEQLVSTLRPGDFFGEHSLLMDTAWATRAGVHVRYVCETLVETLVLTKVDFNSVLQAYPASLREEVARACCITAEDQRTKTEKKKCACTLACVCAHIHTRCVCVCVCARARARACARACVCVIHTHTQHENIMFPCTGGMCAASHSGECRQNAGVSRVQTDL